MPEVEEVFRLATNKVKPDPNALERQHRRQRSAARGGRVRAYVAVAAVIAILGITVFALSRVVGRDGATPEEEGQRTPTDLTFVDGLPAGATAQTPALVDRRGRQTSTVQGVPADAYAPSLTRDGSAMAFVTAPPALGYSQIGVMGTDGTGAHVVATPGIVVSTVAISPDGTRVAFEGMHDANTDIYVVNTAGTGLRRLTEDRSTDQFPAWSPDGTTIVYDNAGKEEDTSDPQFSPTAELFTVSADGGPVTRITHNGQFDAAPSYSADGKTIVAESWGGLSMMDPDGSHRRMIYVSTDTAFTPRLSPDGKTIAFTYYKDVPVRPSFQFADQYGTRPIVIVALADVATGRVTKLRHVAMASDLNTPQWVDDQHILVMRAPAGGL